MKPRSGHRSLTGSEDPLDFGGKNKTYGQDFRFFSGFWRGFGKYFGRGFRRYLGVFLEGMRKCILSEVFSGNVTHTHLVEQLAKSS